MKLNHQTSKQFALAIAAALTLCSGSVYADTSIKRLLDLQLKKGIINQQEYDEFMAITAEEIASQPAAPARVEVPVSQNNQNIQINQNSITKNNAPQASSDGQGIALINNDTLKVELFGTVDVSAGYTSKSLVPSGEMPTSIGPWISGGVKTPVVYKGSNGNATLYPQSNMTNQAGLFNSALSTSSWGIRASRDLGEGRKAFILLDSAFNPITGQITDQAHNQSANSRYPTTAYATSSLNGQLFGKEAYIGLSDTEKGRLSFGRNNNFILDVMNAYAPLQKAGLFMPFGNGVYGGGGGISENGRVDNSVKYTNKFSNINVGLMHGFGGSGGLKHGAEGTAGVIGYENGSLGVQLVYEEFKDLLKTSVDTSTADVIDLTAYNQKALLLTSKYKLTESMRMQAGVQQATLGAPSADSNITLINSIYGETVQTSKAYVGQDFNINTWHWGIDYDLNEKLYIGTAYSLIDLPKYNYGTNNASHYLGGKIQALSGLAIYKLYKGTDVYAGMVFTHYSGSAFENDLTHATVGSPWTTSSKQGSIYEHNIFTTAAGVRFRF